MAAFDYTIDGRVLGIRESFQSFRDPGRPLPPVVTKLTGITDEMLVGQSVDAERVTVFLADAALVLAHNASFDRPFCEKLSPRFAALPWGCSFRDIQWKTNALEKTKKKKKKKNELPTSVPCQRSGTPARGRPRRAPGCTA